MILNLYDITMLLYQFAGHNMFAAAQEIKELWMEYEENSSMEAKVVKDFDKVICIQISKWETFPMWFYCAQGSEFQTQNSKVCL